MGRAGPGVHTATPRTGVQSHVMRPSLRSTAIALTAASGLALLEIFRTAMMRVLDGNAMTGMEVLHRVLPTWITVVAASPWCAVMARRFPFRAGRIGRTLLAHFGGALVFVAIHMALLILAHNLMNGVRGVMWEGMAHRYAFYVAMEMSLYGSIVVVLLLLDTRRESAERALASARLAERLTTARLDSLRAQLRPHFLFNTLNTLAVLARRGDGAQVDRAIGDLGDLLRASFDANGRNEIPLGEELGFLERYVALQRLRFPDRLEVTWDVEPEARSVAVPALLVQPLVENAIEHGLATARGGRVRVGARRDGDTLAIEVSDDGPGFTTAPPGTTSPGVDAPRETGIGLAHTRERLTLLYGTDASLATGDRPDGGGVVRIVLPWRTAVTCTSRRGATAERSRSK